MRTIVTKCVCVFVFGLAFAACSSGPPATGADRELFVVRHAEAWSNVPEEQRAGRAGDATDALTPKGVLQAEAAAAKLVDQGITVVFHSPRGRTRETAEIVAKRCGAQVVELQDLRPMEDGETVEAATARALAALAARTEAGNWAVVSHSGITSAVLGEADGTPADERLQKRLATGGMRQVRWLADGSWLVR